VDNWAGIGRKNRDRLYPGDGLGSRGKVASERGLLSVFFFDIISLSIC
jgi:hypothetical protein